MQTQCDSKTKQVKVIHDMMNVILVPLCCRETEGISGIYSNIVCKVKFQTKNLNCDGQVCACFTFCHQRTRWQTRDNTVQDVTGQKLTVLCCSWDLICLPLTDINEWEEATQKNTYGCLKKWRSANKRCTTRTELWQLIKAHAPKRRCYKLCWRFHCLFLTSSSLDHREI